MACSPINALDHNEYVQHIRLPAKKVARGNSSALFPTDPTITSRMKERIGEPLRATVRHHEFAQSGAYNLALFLASVQALLRRARRDLMVST